MWRLSRAVIEEMLDIAYVAVATTLPAGDSLGGDWPGGLARRSPTMRARPSMPALAQAAADAARELRRRSRRTCST
jgi:hypothetical protein